MPNSSTITSDVTNNRYYQNGQQEELQNSSRDSKPLAVRLSLHISVSTREGKTPVCDVMYHGLILTTLRDLSPDFFFVTMSL
jgi:hypothetical protein